MWAYGIPCPAMVSPNVSTAQRGQAVVPGSSPYIVRGSGFRPTHFIYVSKCILFQLTLWHAEGVT